MEGAQAVQVVCGDFSCIFPRYADMMRDICAKISALPDAWKVVLYGSYAKGIAEPESDIDLAVFFDTEENCLRRQYHQLARICANTQVDIQVQPFHAYELSQPCGIIEEVVAYGIELRVS
jgi:predicted nucleotidyltransferase